MEKENNRKFIQSYLYTDYGAFFISTIYRKSSAMLAPENWYYETFAWEIKDTKTNERGKWIADHSGALSENRALSQHDEVCRQLTDTGKFQTIDREMNAKGYKNKDEPDSN